MTTVEPFAAVPLLGCWLKTVPLAYWAGPDPGVTLTWKPAWVRIWLAVAWESPTTDGTETAPPEIVKSRRNAIAIAATADETARLICSAKTDLDPHITYEPERRPEVSNLVLLTALCEGTDPPLVAEQIGTRGAAELKRRATEAINERLRTIRATRAELVADRAYLRQVLRAGSFAAAAIADQTLEIVSAAMHTSY